MVVKKIIKQTIWLFTYVIILQVEMAVRVRGSTELHRGDMELLPIRDLGVALKEVAPDHPEITAVVGPLCFL